VGHPHSVSSCSQPFDVRVVVVIVFGGVWVCHGPIRRDQCASDPDIARCVVGG
jgi:hypothetical protein